MYGWMLNVCYLLCIASVAPMLLWKRFRAGKYKEGWTQKLRGHLPVNDRSAPLVWLHAVSVGEVLLLRTVVAELKRLRPDCRLMISTTTATGFRMLREKFPDCRHAYFPLDFTWSVQTALRRVQPDLVILAELELWPNFLHKAAEQQIPVIVINARLSEKSYRGYRQLRWLLRPCLASLQMVAAQTQEYAGRFISLGVREDRIRITGSIKFDGVQGNRENEGSNALRRLFHLGPEERVLVAGSTQDRDEELVLQAYTSLRAEFPYLRLVIVPRHPERADAVAARIAEFGFCVLRRSRPERLNPVGGRTPVGLLDTVGELGTCWGLADLALVGGSFSRRGGQNMIEPAAYGAAICFGPHTWNFRHVVDMFLTAEAARVVRNREELVAFLREMLRHPDRARQMGCRARELVLAQSGATARTVELILDLLPAPNERLRRSA